MAQILGIKSEHDSGLFDSETHADCVTEKVVDVTEDCPNREGSSPVIFLFTRARRGRIAQIHRPYEGESFMGVRIHFFVEELAGQMDVRPEDDTFGSWARQCGLTKQELRRLIEANAQN